jgi:hypothetical protein
MVRADEPPTNKDGMRHKGTDSEATITQMRIRSYGRPPRIDLGQRPGACLWTGPDSDVAMMKEFVVGKWTKSKAL